MLCTMVVHLGRKALAGFDGDTFNLVAPSTEAKKEGELTLKATEAYDSQLIYEGFSNFQTIPDGSDPSVYTNRKIAENVDLFKSWGVTSFEMARQRRGD